MRSRSHKLRSLVHDGDGRSNETIKFYAQSYAELSRIVHTRLEKNLVMSCHTNIQ
jgi:hypothetical protein